jgi:hypothetical protein
MKNEIITIEVLRSKRNIEPKQVFYNFRIKKKTKIVGYFTRSKFYTEQFRNQTGNTSIEFLNITEVLKTFIEALERR